jgi:hypothetical protein
MPTLKGKWYLKENIKVNDVGYPAINFSYSVPQGWRYGISLGFDTDLNQLSYQDGEGNWVIAYKDDSWVYPEYRHISFSDDGVTVDEDFYFWLRKNAVPLNIEGTWRFNKNLTPSGSYLRTPIQGLCTSLHFGDSPVTELEVESDIYYGYLWGRINDSAYTFWGATVGWASGDDYRVLTFHDNLTELDPEFALWFYENAHSMELKLYSECYIAETADKIRECANDNNLTFKVSDLVDGVQTVYDAGYSQGIAAVETKGVYKHELYINCIATTDYSEYWDGYLTFYNNDSSNYSTGLADSYIPHNDVIGATLSLISSDNSESNREFTIKSFDGTRFTMTDGTWLLIDSPGEVSDNVTQVGSSSGVELPSLTNPATNANVLSGKEYIDATGTKQTGTMTERSSSSLTASGKTVTVPAGYYPSQVTKSVSTATQATPSVSISDTGLITATATQSAGYVSAGTKSGTKQLPATTVTSVTPTASGSTIATKGSYVKSDISIKADANFISSNIKDGVQIWGITGSYAGGGYQAKNLSIGGVSVWPSGDRLGISILNNGTLLSEGGWYDYYPSGNAIIPENIRAGKTLLGVTGTCTPCADVVTATIQFNSPSSTFAGLIHIHYTGADGKKAVSDIEFRGTAQSIIINALQHTPIVIKADPSILLTLQNFDQCSYIVDAAASTGVAQGSTVLCWSDEQFCTLVCTVGTNTELEALGALCDWELVSSSSLALVITNYHPTHYLICDVANSADNGVNDGTYVVSPNSSDSVIFDDVQDQGAGSLYVTNIRWSTTGNV